VSGAKLPPPPPPPPPPTRQSSTHNPAAANGLRAFIHGIGSGAHPRGIGSRCGGAGRLPSRIGTGFSRTSRLTSGADGWEVLDDYYTRGPSPPPGAWQVAQQQQMHAIFTEAVGATAQPVGLQQQQQQQQQQQHKTHAAEEDEELQWQQPQNQQQLGGWPLDDDEEEAEKAEQQQQQQQQPWGGCVDAHGQLRELPPLQRCPDADALAWEYQARQQQHLLQQQEQFELQVAAAEGSAAGSDGGRHASIIPLRVLRPKK
jgi:hypothetical protein